MTLVVSDNSPLNLLVRLGLIDMLPELFGSVVIPDAVADEMADPRAPAAVRAFIAAPPAWLVVQSPASPLDLPRLDRGEAAAVSLAVELRAAVLIDELAGRREAQALGLSVVGAVGVLEVAADAGHIADLASVHAALRGLDFHVSESILLDSMTRHTRRILARHANPPGGPP